MWSAIRDVASDSRWHRDLQISKTMLSTYLDGAVTGKQMQALDEHLRQCPVCEREFQSLRRTRSVSVSDSCLSACAGRFIFKAPAGDFARSRTASSSPVR